MVPPDHRSDPFLDVLSQPVKGMLVAPLAMEGVEVGVRGNVEWPADVRLRAH